jgi:hypothetical protein
MKELNGDGVLAGTPEQERQDVQGQGHDAGDAGCQTGNARRKIDRETFCSRYEIRRPPFVGISVLFT